MVIGLGRPGVAVGSEDDAEDAGGAYERLARSLEKEYPDRDSVQQGYLAVAARLEEFIKSNPASPELAKVRSLCAEVLLIGGDRGRAIGHWQVMAEDRRDPEGQARGLYLLATDYYLREESARARELYSRLVDGFPRSEWTEKARIPLRYLELLASRDMPAFELVVKRGGKKAKLNLSNLAGKVTLVHFWRSDTAKHGEFIETLGRNPDSSLEQAIKKYPVLRGKVMIFGVNLDTDRKSYEEARDRWNIPWAQVHDGKGFATPFAKTLGIPRVPHWLVLGPGGKIWYLGADIDKFYAYASEALKRHRIALEKKK
ncbi:MAG: thioredoxin-like domain-containing protein [Planctomycetota bacterium]|nr:thioredoxin-like domain-containing protein [Planctomycetota bacterium]